MVKVFRNTAWLLLLILLVSSCVSQKRLRYFQDKTPSITQYPVDTTYDAIIQPNDILEIFVASISEEASRYFNFSTTANPDVNNFVVDHYGYVQLPLVGNVYVAGLNTRSARDTVIHSLEKYLIKPSVRVNIRNFRVTVLGEVFHPGVYPVANEKITLTEALAFAGDLTPFALREKIMVIRETNGKKSFDYVDITARDFVISPFYNLHTNDIVYVETSRRKEILTNNYVSLLTIVTTPIVAVILALRVSNLIK